MCCVDGSSVRGTLTYFATRSCSLIFFCCGVQKVNEDDNKIDHPSGDIETPTNECVAEDDHSPSKTVCAMDTDITCVICLAEYEKGDETCTGQHCVHRYHTNCLYQWLEQHTRCPVCRDEIVTDAEFQVAASKLMDRKRFNELIAPKRVQEAMTLTRTLSTARVLVVPVY